MMSYDSTIFRWEAGPKPVDGIWAPWWYKSVHKSTGFQQSKKYPVVCGLLPILLWFVAYVTAT